MLLGGLPGFRSKNRLHKRKTLAKVEVPWRPPKARHRTQLCGQINRLPQVLWQSVPPARCLLPVAPDDADKVNERDGLDRLGGKSEARRARQ